MANLMQLNVLSPDSYVFQADNISYIDAHTEGGAVGILPRHATMVAALDAAPLKYRDDNGVAHYLFVDTGYLEVKDNVVTVLSVAAELAESIDVERHRQPWNALRRRSKTWIRKSTCRRPRPT